MRFVYPFALLALASCGGSSSTPDAPPPADPPADPPPVQAPPAATCPSGDAFMTLAGKIVVPVSLDGDTSHKFILDTGAPVSVIDTSLGAQYGTKAVEVKVGGVTQKITFEVSSLGGLGTGIVGIIGQDVFGTVLTIDYPRSRFWIEDKLHEDALLACTHVRGAPVVADAEVEDYVYVRGALEASPGWFLVDSGASYGATRKSVFAALSAAHARPTLTGFYTPAAVGTFWADVATMGPFEVDGLAVTGILTRTIDDDLLPAPHSIGSDTLLGVLPSGFLHHFMVTIDFGQNKLRLDAKKDDALAEPRGMFVTGISLEETTSSPVHVTGVLPGSAAADAGIAVGDAIVSIEGKAIGDIDAFSRSFELASPTNGATVHVEVLKAGASTSTSLSLETRDLLQAP